MTVGPFSDTINRLINSYISLIFRLILSQEHGVLTLSSDASITAQRWGLKLVDV